MSSSSRRFPSRPRRSTISDEPPTEEGVMVTARTPGQRRLGQTIGLLGLVVVAVFAVGLAMAQTRPGGGGGGATPGGGGGGGGNAGGGNGTAAANNTGTRRVLWKGDFPGGTYEVNIASIISVSIHDFIVDRVLKVTEVTISTAGSVEARFYYVEPNLPTAANLPGGSAVDAVRNKAVEGLDRVTGGQASDAINSDVMKSYPTTTHAHTVEYRLASKAEAQAVFNSIETAWRGNVAGGYPATAPDAAPASGTTAPAP